MRLFRNRITGKKKKGRPPLLRVKSAETVLCHLMQGNRGAYLWAS